MINAILDNKFFQCKVIVVNLDNDHLAELKGLSLILRRMVARQKCAPSHSAYPTIEVLNASFSGVQRVIAWGILVRMCLRDQKVLWKKLCL